MQQEAPGIIPHLRPLVLHAQSLKPYQEVETQPFQCVERIKDSLKILRPVKDYDLNVAWRFARKRAGIKEPYRSHMLRDLLKTGLGYRLGLRQETTDFLTGHVARIDPNKYLQIIHEPDVAIKEWEKIRRYPDSGIDTETHEELERLRATVSQQQAKLDHLEAISVERLTPAAGSERRPVKRRRKTSWLQPSASTG
jgi:hypothetical protein